MGLGEGIGEEALGLEGGEFMELVKDRLAIENLFLLFLLLVWGVSSPLKIISSEECSVGVSDSSASDTSASDISASEFPVCDAFSRSDTESGLVRSL